MAQVFLAVHEDVPNLKVVLKILSDPRLVERFRQEADKLALLDGNPHICQIKHFFNHGDEIVIAMEYIDGQTLDQVVESKGPFSPHEASRITADILDTLDFAHSKGIFHRDIKPSNIMIDGSGQCKIIDFGIAKAETDPNLTIAGSSCGTPTYMAPEQFNPDSKIDYRLADIYAVGTTLYYLVSGALPFEGDNAFALRDAKLFNDPEPPSKKYSGVPKALDKIVLKALQKDPTDRYLSATEMIAALQQAGLSEEQGKPTIEIPGAQRRQPEKPKKITGKSPIPKIIWISLPILALIIASYFIFLNDTPEITYNPPQLIMPHNAEELNVALPKFVWTSNDLDSRYRLEYGTSPDLQAGQSSDIITDMMYQPVEPFPDGIYYWHVVAIDENDKSGLLSETWTFSITTETGPVAIPQGRLIVAIDPSGDLYIDGKKEWSKRSSGEIFLDTGTYVVRARNSASNQKSIDKTVTITDGINSSLDFAFSFPPQVAKVDSGTVQVGSRPILGGNISINGQDQNRATPNSFRLPVGEYIISVKLDYNGQVLERSETISIVADSSKKIFIDFDK